MEMVENGFGIVSSVKLMSKFVVVNRRVHPLPLPSPDEFIILLFIRLPMSSSSSPLPSTSL
jgi:hypothetical protein